MNKVYHCFGTNITSAGQYFSNAGDGSLSDYPRCILVRWYLGQNFDASRLSKDPTRIDHQGNIGCVLHG